MYPVLRLIKEQLGARGRAQLFFDTHVSHHVCWPWDLDPWMELNNGRTLTLYDLGRIPLMTRIGMTAALRAQGWGMTVAGLSVRYRRRIRMFQRFEMRGRILGWDHRFFYMEQSMWREDEALNNLLLRIAVTNRSGIAPPRDMIAALGESAVSPALPDWVLAWIEAEAQRPWPPARDG